MQCIILYTECNSHSMCNYTHTNVTQRIPSFYTQCVVLHTMCSLCNLRGPINQNLRYFVGKKNDKYEVWSVQLNQYSQYSQSSQSANRACLATATANATAPIWTSHVNFINHVDCSPQAILCLIRNEYSQWENITKHRKNKTIWIFIRSSTIWPIYEKSRLFRSLVWTLRGTQNSTHHNV